MEQGKCEWCEVSLKKLKIELPYDPAIPFLWIYPEKPQFKRCMYPMLTAALSTVEKLYTVSKNQTGIRLRLRS